MNLFHSVFSWIIYLYQVKCCLRSKNLLLAFSGILVFHNSYFSVKWLYWTWTRKDTKKVYRTSQKILQNLVWNRCQTLFFLFLRYSLDRRRSRNLKTPNDIRVTFQQPSQFPFSESRDSQPWRWTVRMFFLRS